MKRASHLALIRLHWIVQLDRGWATGTVEEHENDSAAIVEEFFPATDNQPDTDSPVPAPPQPSWL
jgi:hypothetical protein